eukprot:2234893-Pyramimonas_sp.AAC.1
MDIVTFPHTQTSMDVLGSQGWVSCGLFLVDWPPLYLTVDPSLSRPDGRARPSAAQEETG